MIYWELHEQHYNDAGYKVLTSFAHDDSNPEDFYDDSAYDVDDMIRKIEACDLYWLVLKTEIVLDGVTIGESILGGVLVNDLSEIEEHFIEDLEYEAMCLAREWMLRNKPLLDP